MNIETNFLFFDIGESLEGYKTLNTLKISLLAHISTQIEDKLDKDSVFV